MKPVNALLIAVLVAQAPMAFAGKGAVINQNYQEGKAKVSAQQVEAQAKAAAKGATSAQTAQRVGVQRKAAPAPTKQVAAPAKAAPVAAKPAGPVANNANDALVSSAAAELKDDARTEVCDASCQTTVENVTDVATNPSSKGVAGKAKAKIQMVLLDVREAVNSLKRRLGQGRANVGQAIKSVFAKHNINEQDFNNNCGKKI